MAEKKSGPGPGKEMRLYLVDASGYAFRAYHATIRQAMTTKRGLPTGATLVFTRMLLKLLREERPTHVVVVWDPKGKSFRNDLYPAYKATRAQTPPDLVPQFAYMRKLVDAFNFPALDRAGLEADDVIGALARRAEAEGIETVIVSGDKDLTQLVTDRVTILDTLKEVRLDRAGVIEKMSVPPEQVVDLLALWGDSSDNVPGVPKVGEKTAKKLMAEYGSLDAILASAGEIKGVVGQNLVEFAEQARLSKQLVTIADVPLEFKWDDFALRAPDRRRLGELFDELEFQKLKAEFGEDTVKLEYDAYRLITNRKELSAFVAAALSAGRVAVDTETTSLDPLSAELVGISLAIEPGQAVYVPVGHVGFASVGQLDKAEALAALKPLFESEAVELVGQNLKYDLAVLLRAGVELPRLGFDTMVASYLVNSRRRSHGLDELASEYLGHTTIKYEDVCGKGKNQIGFAEVGLEQALRYSGEDADVALRLADKLGPLLDELELRELFERVEMPLVPVLARMERVGVKVDAGKLGELGAEFELEIARLSKEIYREAGEEFNIASPKQLGEVLFEKLKLAKGKKTKTGFSTGEEVLQKLAEDHALPGLVLEYRTLAKLKNTYTDALARLVHPLDGRIHTSYNQTVASTGRLSSSDPNLQNIPVRQGIGRRIREAFVGEGGALILSADYSQIELRLMAHISEEPALLEAFAQGEDIHARTAREIFGLAAGEVTPDQRRRAKVINFGILYGMSAHGLTRQLDVDHQAAQAYIDAYFDRYPRVRAYMEAVVKEARAEGRVKTIMGRRLPLPEINSQNHVVRSGAEREAINAPLQGSAADIIKVAMIALDAELRRRGLKSKMIMQVHDELVFEAVPAELEELQALVKDKMEGAAELKAPLLVEMAAAKNWAEAH